MKKIDWYIIRKFLGTFFFSIALIIVIVIVFDVSEKIDDFIQRGAPLDKIILVYYLNFIPYFVNLFSPLFTFIAVIFFTSKMASNTEIVAIISSGVSFRRLLRPFFISATALCILSFMLSNFVIPETNKNRIAFEIAYIRNIRKMSDQNIHRQIAPGTFISVESFNSEFNQGFRFSMEKLENGELKYRLSSDAIHWDSIQNHWKLINFSYREVNGMKEKLITGAQLDTVKSFSYQDLYKKNEYTEMMNYFELNEFIRKEKLKGSGVYQFYEVEKYKRVALPFATIILTLIAVALSSRKVRGGIGMHIAFGFLLSFTYILFLQISTTFATNGNVPASIAVWIPNLIYTGIGLVLLRRAPK